MYGVADNSFYDIGLKYVVLNIKFQIACFLALLACENIRFSSLFAAGDVSRNVPSGEERGETDVFAGYRFANWYTHAT